MPAIIHYIDGDRTNRAPDNLASLCPHHLELAIHHQSELSPTQIIEFKTRWEKSCLSILMGLARLRP